MRRLRQDCFQICIQSKLDRAPTVKIVRDIAEPRLLTFSVGSTCQDGRTSPGSSSCLFFRLHFCLEFVIFTQWQIFFLKGGCSCLCEWSRCDRYRSIDHWSPKEENRHYAQAHHKLLDRSSYTDSAKMI